jgi:hypothetical protein
VTGLAAAFALEYGPASHGVSSTARARRRITKETDVPHYELRLASQEFRWRHGRSRNPVADDVEEFLVGISATELAPAKIDARNAIAFLTVAGRTIDAVKPRSFLDVSYRVAQALRQNDSGSQSEDYEPDAQNCLPNSQRFD